VYCKGAELIMGNKVNFASLPVLKILNSTVYYYSAKSEHFKSTIPSYFSES
jgi:hypothetical protein